MAVTAVVDVEGRSGGDNEALARRHTRPIRVHTNALNHTPTDILATDGVPRKFDLCPWDLGARCTDRKAEQDRENPFLWAVTIEYGTLIGGATDPTQRDENPTQRPAEVDVDWENHERIVQIDIDGNPIVNSAGDLLDPGVKIDDNRPVITIVRNQASFNLLTAELYYDAINEDVFLGFSPETLKIRLKGKQQWENEQYYWQVTASIHVRRKKPDPQNPSEEIGGWIAREIDQGYRKKVGDKRELILDKKTGQPVSHPVLLDGEGGELGENQPPKYRTFNVYKKLPFNGLMLL